MALARNCYTNSFLLVVVVLLYALCLPRTVNAASDFFAKGIRAQPAIFNGTLYYPSWNGTIYAIKAMGGSLVWEKNLGALTELDARGFAFGANTFVASATPTVAGDLLIIGISGPAVVLAVERATGDLVWSTQLDSHPAAVVSIPGTACNGSFYVGTSSLEGGLNTSQCCTFRGSLSKLDIQTGKILWQTYTLPDNGCQLGGYAGASIQGRSPSIDVMRNHVYVATGNLYSAPQYVKDCQEEENNQTTPTQPSKCIEPGNHENSILAFDMDTGNITWYRQLSGCADFGEAPMMLSICVNGTRRDIVAVVQKSGGYAWVLDRDTGDIMWTTFTGPESIYGGGTWGAATDEYAGGKQWWHVGKQWMHVYQKWKEMILWRR